MDDSQTSHNEQNGIRSKQEYKDSVRLGQAIRMQVQGSGEAIVQGLEMVGGRMQAGELSTSQARPSNR